MKQQCVSALAILMGLTGWAYGDEAIPPLAKNPLADIRAGEQKHLNIDYYATAYLLFIPVTGKASFKVDFTPETYSMKSRVKTTGIADIFVDYNLNIGAAGYVHDDGLRPYSFVSQNHDGKKNRRVELIYGEDDVAMTAKPEFGNLGFPPATPEQKMDAHDPISALVNFMVSTAPNENPCRGPIKTFDGRQLTHLSLSLEKETRIKTKMYQGDALECHVKVDRVAGYKKGDKGGNLSGIDGPMKMWVAKTEHGLHVPVKFVVDTEDIGKITLEARHLSFDTIVTEEAKGAAEKG